MTIAKAAIANLAYVIESSYGVNPGTGFKFARFNSEGFRHTSETVQSGEHTSDRNPQGAIRVNVGSGGPLQCEFVPVDYNDWLQGAMHAAYSTPVALTSQSIDISGSAGNTATLTDAATSGAFTNIVVGQWLKLAGFTSSANNGFVRCTSKASNNSIGVEGRVFSNEAGQTDIAITAKMIRPGTTATSFSIERQASDAAVYMLALGCMVNGFNLEARSRGIVTASFDLLGKFPATSGSSGAGSVTPAGVIRAANTIDNVLNLREGDFGADSTIKATELSFQFSNNIQDLPAIGTLGPVELALGRVTCQGRLSAYLESVSLANKFEAGTETKLHYRMIWATGEAVLVTFPAVDIGEYEAVIPGNEGAILQNLTFFPKKDANGVAVQFDIF